MNEKMLKYACTAVYEDIKDMINDKIYNPEVEDNINWIKEQAKKYDLNVKYDLKRIDFALEDLMDEIN